MAYHNLNEKNIPLTSYPSVPVASPPAAYSPHPAPIAQPVYVQQPGQPVVYPPQMYQPVYPQGQPGVAYAQAPPQQYSPVYASYQPVYATPSPTVAQPAPSAPTNYEELRTALRARQYEFSTRRYLKQANHFTSKNWCKFFGAMIVWGLLGWGINSAINAMTGRTRYHSWSEGGWPAGGDHFDTPIDCQDQLRQDELKCGGMGCFKTKCELDGSFSPKQTLGSQCWCVDEQGIKFPETTQACSVFATDCAVRRTQTACEYRRAMETQACGNKLGCFVTTCDTDGNFAPKQNLGSGCWCVNEKGEELNGTRTTCDSNTVCEHPGRAWTMPAYAMGHSRPIALWLFLHFLVAVIFWSPVLAGLYVAVFNAIKKDTTICFRDFFSCFSCRYYCKLLPLSFALRFFETLLSILIIPGIWWAIATFFAIPLHKEHSFLGVCGSIRLSMMVLHRNFCSMLCFLFVLVLLQVLGFICLIIGLLYTMPLAFVALCYCYHDLIGIVSEVPFAGPVDVPVAVHV